ncbi:MAG: DUF305 domain-containing protein [Leifsonia xyli]|nr:MAG: DUF305 domain-containing protein [Leifsonia xyli]
MRIAIPLALAFVATASPAGAQEPHDHHAMAHASPAQASNPNATAFADQTSKAMERMHAGMMQAPTNGDPRHDFLSQMIPHHQGAVDMAKAALLATDDPEIRNLAQSIIVEQQYEIDLMTRLLAAKPKAAKAEIPQPKDSK